MQTKIVLLICLSLFIAVGCSTRKHHPVASVPDKTLVTMANVKAADYTTVEFKRGHRSLGPLSKEYLAELVQTAHQNGRKISNIKILAWGDRAYNEKKVASTNEIALANERANSIKKYLKDNLNTSESIDSYNMAKKPGLWSQLVKNDEFHTKEAFKNRAPSSLESKASKAVVIMEYQK
jgi:hypothetical protein